MTTTASVMVRESNIQKGDSDTASHNVGSFVKINSISIDLEDNVNVKTNVEKCDHFSIRGYVSEVRNRNWKLCWPFALDDEKNVSEEQKSLLPPLTSKKFRWWSCQGCRQEVGCSRDHDHDMRLNSHSVGCKSKDDHSQTQPLCTAVLPRTDGEVAPKTDLVEKRKSDIAQTSTHVKNMQQDKKEVVVAEAGTNFIEPENSSETHAVVEHPRISSAPEEINLNVMQEIPEYDTAVTESVEPARSRSPVDICKHTSRIHDGNVDVELATSLGPCKSSTKNCMTENPDSVDKQLEELNLASGSSGLACLNAVSGDVVKNQTDKSDSRVLVEHDRAPSESVEIVGNGFHSTSSGPQRRKTRKVRLLTDLLGNKEDAKIELVSMEVSPFNAAKSESLGIGMGYVPQGQVSFPENHGAELGDNRKKKLPQVDEERRSSETNSLVNPNKKVKISKGSEEISNAMADSALEGDVSAGLSFQAGTKSHLGKRGTDSISITEKKKSKKNQIADSRSYLVPVGDNFPNQVRDELGIPNKGKAVGGFSFQAVNDAPSSRGMDKSSLAASRKEKKPNLWKNKSKIPQVDDGQSAQYPWTSGLLKEGPSSRSKEIMQTGSVNVSFQPPDAEAVDPGLQLSLGGYLAPKKSHNRYNPQIRDGRSPLLWQEGTPMDETVRRNVETNYISDSAVPSKPGSYALFKKRVHGELNGKLVPYNMPIPNEKEKNKSQIEGCQSLGKQADISGASNYQQMIKPKGHSAPAVSRKRSEKIAHNISDQGASDDIPMEIVELMAQIQYERRLDYTENNKIMMKSGNEGRNSQMIEYDKVYGTERIRVPEEASKRTNSQARNGRNGNSTARKNVQPSKQKSVDYFRNGNEEHLSNCHIGQKKPSSSVQPPAPSFTKCSCARNCKWDTNMVGHGFYNAGGVQRGPCDTCPIVPRPTEEAAPIWSSGVPLQRPVRYVVPQNGASQRSNLHVVPSASGLLPKGGNINKEHELKYLKPGSVNLEIPSQHIGSETFSRRNADYQFTNKQKGNEHQQNPRGSLDLYSNETIPAMHLLSLMDAGMPSGTTFNAGGNTKFLKRDHPLDNNSKEYSQMPVGVYGKPRDAMKHPLDYHGKHQLPLKPHNFFPVNPMAGPSTSSFRHEKAFDRANDFTGQVSFGSRGKEKVQKSSGAPAQNRGRKPLNSQFPSAGPTPNHNSVGVHSTQKDFLGSSSSMGFPLQSRALGKSTELKLDTPSYTGTFRPLKSKPESLNCSTNRNPADFSSPEPGNKYMIKGEDLKVRKSRKRPGLTPADQRKRQRNTKRTTENDRA